MDKEVLAVDVDEVLFPFLTEFSKYHNNQFGTDVNPDHFYSYVFEDVLDLTVNQVVERVYAFHEVDDIQVEPLEEAQESIQKLSQDYDLVVITARHPRFEAPTQRWLNEYFPKAFSEIVLIGYAEVMENPQTKLGVCQDLGAIALIDDSIKHLSDCVEDGMPGILFGNYPWNQAEELPSGITRCEDWRAVEAHFSDQL